MTPFIRRIVLFFIRNTSSLLLPIVPSTYIYIIANLSSTAHSHEMETYQMETIPHMETFLIYQTAYYIKQGGFGKNFSVKSLKCKQFLMKIT